MKRFKIAIIHPNLIAGGGSEVCALWMIEALKDDYDVTIITSHCEDFAKLNTAYFSSLKKDQVSLVKVPMPRYLKRRFNALRGALLERFCKRAARSFDLMISSYNVMDFGKKGIQYIVDFSFDDTLRRKLDKGRKGLRNLLYADSFFRSLYLKLCNIVSGSSRCGWLNNVTIANSGWTAGIIEESFGLHPEVIYHPVPGNYQDINWDERGNGFVCMARLVPEKGIDNVIEIMKELRRRGLDLHLHLLGREDDKRYVDYLKRLSKENSSWLFMEGLVLGDEKIKLISQHKFGISGRLNEPFGIAVGEMVRSGLIVWVPDGGGQREIVGHSDLIYTSVTEAADKIEKVIKDTNVLQSLRSHLKKRSNEFSEDKYKESIRGLVRRFLDENENK